MQLSKQYMAYIIPVLCFPSWEYCREGERKGRVGVSGGGGGLGEEGREGGGWVGWGRDEGGMLRGGGVRMFGWFAVISTVHYLYP